MSAWTDARDNIRHGFVSAWTAMSPEARAWCIGFVIGFAAGAVAVGLLLC